MQPIKKARFKICCISSIYEPVLAIQYDTSALGHVSAMLGGSGIISVDLIVHIEET